jgi:hypothetical protein
MARALMEVQSSNPNPQPFDGDYSMSNLASLKAASAIVLVTAFAAGMTTSAAADTTWQQNHPRREQVNNRLANQNARIHNEVKEGEMSKAKAARLHKDDRQIRNEERAMASQNNGHITKLEQDALNQQENRVSGKIGP